MTQKTRKDFKKWKVDIVYEIQEGACARCGASLEQGFHRHHKDGNHSNNSIDNIELLCPRCHLATLGESITEYQKRLYKLLDDIDTLIRMAFEGKLSGSTAEQLVELEKMGLKAIRELTGVYQGMEMPSASLLLERGISDIVTYKEVYMQGWKDGFKAGVNINDNSKQQ